MSRKKTMPTACLSFLLIGGVAAADTLGRDFAHCAGRYSALTEHLWTVQAPAAEAAHRRDLFLDLVEATAPADTALTWRVEAKAAQRALLETATFATGPRAIRAHRDAFGALDLCDRLLMGH
jgi:hypothetical protein